MARRSHKSKKSSSRIANDQRPRSLKYYLAARKPHVNIGKYATKAFVQVRHFLSQEIPLPTMARSAVPVKSSNGNQPDDGQNRSRKQEPDAVNDNGSLIVPDEPKVHEGHQKTIEEIKELTKRSNEVLCSARTVFPFSLFTDHVVLDRTKLTITKRDFFMSSQVMSIRIEDVLNVTTDVGPFLGSITVAIRIMNSDDHITVNNLHRYDAIHLKHIIQGYVIAQHNKIDVAHLNKEELVETLTDLGHDLNV